MKVEKFKLSDQFWRVKLFVISDKNGAEQVESEFPDETSHLPQRRGLETKRRHFRRHY